MATLESNIRRFTAVLKGRIEEMRSQQFPRNGTVYRKTTCVCILDTLAKSIFPAMGNKQRYLGLLRQFSGWTDHTRMSLPHLAKLLDLNPNVACQDLRDLVHQNIGKWRSGMVVPLSRDLDEAEAQKVWPQANSTGQEPFQRVKMDFLRHDSLFYAYRNSLVHEVRSLGHGIESEDDTIPYYHSMSWPDLGNIVTWELVYPTQFFEQLCLTAIENLERYYRANSIDPIAPFDFGTYWIEALNE